MKILKGVGGNSYEVQQCRVGLAYDVRAYYEVETKPEGAWKLLKMDLTVKVFITSSKEGV